MGKEEELHIIHMAKIREIKNEEIEFNAMKMDLLRKQDELSRSESTTEKTSIFSNKGSTTQLHNREKELAEREEMVNFKVEQVFAKEREIKQTTERYDSMRQEISKMEQELLAK